MCGYNYGKMYQNVFFSTNMVKLKGFAHYICAIWVYVGIVDMYSLNAYFLIYKVRLKKCKTFYENNIL